MLQYTIMYCDSSFLLFKRSNRHQAKNNFGLIDRSYDSDQAFDPERKKTQWQRFANHVEQLRKDAKADYRVLYLGRHGQGYHNVAESYYGTTEWDV